MSVEIERKFLVSGEGWRARVVSSAALRQGYIGNTELASVRVRLSKGSAALTLKSTQAGISRAEFEYAIPKEDAGQILELFTVNSVSKTRYVLDMQPFVWTVDVFAGPNAGLVLLEIEAPQVFELADMPDWVGADVTDDLRYRNSNLNERPYGTWAEPLTEPDGNDEEESDGQ